MLNPPYKTKKSDKEEMEYILNNLEALEVGATCIALIPISCVTSTTGIGLAYKEKILESHTLEAVMSLPEELFHNSKVSTVTCAIVLTAHKPHPKNKKGDVNWVCFKLRVFSKMDVITSDYFLRVKGIFYP